MKKTNKIFMSSLTKYTKKTETWEDHKNKAIMGLAMGSIVGAGIGFLGGNASYFL